MCSLRYTLCVVVTMMPDIIKDASACCWASLKSTGDIDVVLQTKRWWRVRTCHHIGRVEVSVLIFNPFARTGKYCTCGKNTIRYLNHTCKLTL